MFNFTTFFNKCWTHVVSMKNGFYASWRCLRCIKRPYTAFGRSFQSISMALFFSTFMEILSFFPCFHESLVYKYGTIMGPNWQREALQLPPCVCLTGSIAVFELHAPINRNSNICWNSFFKKFQNTQKSMCSILQHFSTNVENMLQAWNMDSMHPADLSTHIRCIKRPYTAFRMFP